MTCSQVGHFTRSHRTQRKETRPVWASPCLALSLRLTLSWAGLDLHSGSSGLWPAVVLQVSGPLLGLARPSHLWSQQHTAAPGFSREVTHQKPQPTPERLLWIWQTQWAQSPFPARGPFLPNPPNSSSPSPLPASEVMWHSSGEGAGTQTGGHHTFWEWWNRKMGRAWPSPPAKGPGRRRLYARRFWKNPLFVFLYLFV